MRGEEEDASRRSVLREVFLFDFSHVSDGKTRNFLVSTAMECSRIRVEEVRVFTFARRVVKECQIREDEKITFQGWTLSTLSPSGERRVLISNKEKGFESASLIDLSNFLKRQCSSRFRSGRYRHPP
jgi:hypothetical protein